MTGAEPRSRSDDEGRAGQAAQACAGPEGTPSGGSALSQLFRAQYGQLLRFCRLRIRSEADAEDIVQSAFLAARRAYPDKGADELRPLLFTLVRNHALNHLKSWPVRQRSAGDIADVQERLACDQSATPESQVMNAQLLAIAETVIAAMPERRREALRLHRFEGLTYHEIAQRLSVSATTAKSDVALAVAEIAEALARAGGRPVRPER